MLNSVFRWAHSTELASVSGPQQWYQGFIKSVSRDRLAPSIVPTWRVDTESSLWNDVLNKGQGDE
jgi:hypothetical protein